MHSLPGLWSLQDLLQETLQLRQIRTTSQNLIEGVDLRESVRRPSVCVTASLGSVTHNLKQCFSTAGPRPGIGPWHPLYRVVGGSPGICHFSFLSNFHE